MRWCGTVLHAALALLGAPDLGLRLMTPGLHAVVLHGRTLHGLTLHALSLSLWEVAVELEVVVGLEVASAPFHVVDVPQPSAS